MDEDVNRYLVSFYERDHAGNTHEIKLIVDCYSLDEAKQKAIKILDYHGHNTNWFKSISICNTLLESDMKKVDK